MARTIPESPAALIAYGIDDGHANRIFEAFQPAENYRPMRPRTRERNVKMITPALRWIRRRAITFHPIAERVFLAFEGAALGLFFRKLGHAIGILQLLEVYSGITPKSNSGNSAQARNRPVFAQFSHNSKE